MNKLVLAPKSRHHIKFLPLEGSVSDLPKTEAEGILWCQAKYEELERAEDAVRIARYSHPKKGYLISLWELNGLYYLIQSLRNEFGTYNDTVYLSRNRKDCESIAKFLDRNVDGIMRDYRSQILEARDALVKARLERDSHADEPGPEPANKGLPSA